jgi:O-antigen/teichoic acid export membrane protein
MMAALVGRGAFGRVAVVTGLGWGRCLGLFFLLVGSGLSVGGVLLAAIGSSIVALVASWYIVRPRLLGPSTFPQRLFWNYSLPLPFRSLSMQIFRRVDLFTVQALVGASAAGLLVQRRA